MPARSQAQQRFMGMVHAEKEGTLDKSKLERRESWKTYDDGQPLSKSKCIRLYIDKKKESA